jgi:nicotinamidase-related amidase
MKDWLQQVPAEDRARNSRLGIRSALPGTARPALIVVDFTLGFAGRKGLSLDEATREFPTACGPAAWTAVPATARLLKLFRTMKRPVVFSYVDCEEQRFVGSISPKLQRDNWPPAHFNDFPDEIAPREGDWVMGKSKASAFFGTLLAVHLARSGCDTAVVCGGSTSGCVRATAVDAASHGLRTIVVDDCCFDRSYYAHCANLFDLQTKYASVLSLDELVEMLEPAAAPASA